MDNLIEIISADEELMDLFAKYLTFRCIEVTINAIHDYISDQRKDGDWNGIEVTQ